MPTSRITRGILFMCLAVCCFACMNTLVKVRGNLTGTTVNWSEAQLESD